MCKLGLTIFVATIIAIAPSLARADSYDDFIKIQMNKFQNNDNSKCKIRSIQAIESGQKILYELCVWQGKPVYLRGSNDGTPVSVSAYRNGKLVQISLWEGTGGVGFTNERPVVEWNSGEFSKRRVNWQLKASEKSKYLEMAAKEKQILQKFGFR